MTSNKHSDIKVSISRKVSGNYDVKNNIIFGQLGDISFGKKQEREDKSRFCLTMLEG